MTDTHVYTRANTGSRPHLNGCDNGRTLCGGFPSPQVLSLGAARARAHINGAPGARCSRADQLPLLLAHVCALALTLLCSHSYARLSFRRLARVLRVLIGRSTVVERRITYYLYDDDVEMVNPLGQWHHELDARA